LSTKKCFGFYAGTIPSMTRETQGFQSDTGFKLLSQEFAPPSHSQSSDHV